MAAAVVSGAALRRSVFSSSLRPAFGVRNAPQSLLRTRTQPFSRSAAPNIKKYTQDHEWIELSDDGDIGTMGITTYAANALGDVVYVELPTTDLEVSAGDSIGAVESVKSASDIMTPVSGKIIEANSVLEEKPSEINRGPESGGWLAKIQLSKKEELDTLMSKEDYTKFTTES